MARIQQGDYLTASPNVANRNYIGEVADVFNNAINSTQAIAYKANESKLANNQIDLANRALKINNDINIKYQADPTNPEREREFKEQFDMLASEYKVNPLIEGKWGQIKNNVYNNFSSYNAKWQLQQQQTNAQSDLKLGYENAVKQMFLLGQNGANIDEVRMIYANNENALSAPARTQLGDVVVDNAMSKFKHDSLANYLNGVIQVDPAKALTLLNNDTNGVLNDLSDSDTIIKLKESAQNKLLRKTQIDAVDRVANYIIQNNDLFEKAFNGTITTQEASDLINGDIDNNMKAVLSKMFGYTLDAHESKKTMYSEYVLDNNKWVFQDENGKTRKMSPEEKREITSELFLKGSRILNGLEDLSAEESAKEVALFQSQIAQARFFGIDEGDYNDLMKNFVLPATQNIQSEAQQYITGGRFFNKFGYNQIENYFKEEFKNTDKDEKEIDKEQALASVYYWGELRNECDKRGMVLNDINQLSSKEKEAMFDKAAKNAINQTKATSSNPQLWFKAANPQYVSTIRNSLPNSYADEVIKNVALYSINNPTINQNEFDELVDREIRNSYAKLRTSNKSAVFAGNTQYDDIINKYAIQEGVDPLLIKAIIKQESGFKANAKSNAGAKGLMQLMPATAREMGVKNVLDPQQNIAGGVKYFAKQLDKFDGNIPLALAAYNAGAGNVQKYGNKVPPFKETQNYVKNIMATYNSIKG